MSRQNTDVSTQRTLTSDGDEKEGEKTYKPLAQRQDTHEETKKWVWWQRWCMNIFCAIICVLMVFGGISSVYDADWGVGSDSTDFYKAAKWMGSFIADLGVLVIFAAVTAAFSDIANAGSEYSEADIDALPWTIGVLFKIANWLRKGELRCCRRNHTRLFWICLQVAALYLIILICSDFTGCNITPEDEVRTDSHCWIFNGTKTLFASLFTFLDLTFGVLAWISVEAVERMKNKYTFEIKEANQKVTNLNVQLEEFRKLHAIDDGKRLAGLVIDRVQTDSSSQGAFVWRPDSQSSTA